MDEDNTNNELKPISSLMTLFGQSVPVNKKGRPLTEHQELMRYFCDRAKDLKGSIVPARMGFILQGLKTEDLRYMKSVLESETRRPQFPEPGKAYVPTNEMWNRIFWGMLKTDEAKRIQYSAA